MAWSWRAPRTTAGLMASVFFAVVATFGSMRFYEEGMEAFRLMGWPSTWLMTCEGDLEDVCLASQFAESFRPIEPITRQMGVSPPALLLDLAFWFAIGAIALSTIGLATQGVVFVHRLIARP